MAAIWAGVCGGGNGVSGLTGMMLLTGQEVDNTVIFKPAHMSLAVKFMAQI